MSAMASSEKITARSLEVNLTAHCNLSCYGCDHASPVHPEGYLSVEELADDLTSLARVYHVFEFLLTGGEPLLHPRLIEVIDTIRASGVADKITVITNGVLLHKAPEELWRRIDKLGVSIYPGVKRHLSREEIEALAEKNHLLLWYKPTDDFTLKLLHGENPDLDLVREIYSTCTLRASCHTIHNGRYFKCSLSPFTPDWLSRVGIQPPDMSRDGVPVRSNPDLRRQLADYLKDDEPLTACRYCLGCVGKTIPSRQMNRIATRQWLEEKDPDLHELIDWPSLTAAKHALQGVDLTGMLPTKNGQSFRWTAARWLQRMTGVNVTTSRTRLRARVRRLYARG